MEFSILYEAGGWTVDRRNRGAVATLAHFAACWVDAKIDAETIGIGMRVDDSILEPGGSEAAGWLMACAHCIAQAFSEYAEGEGQ